MAQMEVMEVERTVQGVGCGVVEILVKELHRTAEGQVVGEELMHVGTGVMEHWEWVVTEQMPAGTREAAAVAAAITEVVVALTVAEEQPEAVAPVMLGKLARE